MSVSEPAWTVELALLASQHHASEYNRMKYGHQGCPVEYAPLSLHLPDVLCALRERQSRHADQVLWWPCASPATPHDSPLIPAAKQRAALAAGECNIPHPELRRQLSDALSDSIHKASAPHVKTSESHPINVSQIIPPESLLAISSHLVPSTRPSPVLFRLHLPYSPDRYPRVDIPECLPSNEFRSSVAGAFNAALNTKISFPPLPVPSSKIFLSFKRNLKSHPIPGAASEGATADSTLKPHSPFSSTQSPPSRPLSAAYALHPFLSHARPPTAPSPPNKVSKFRPSKSSPTSSRQDTSSQRSFKLGNLLLSSCPGKKVRLSGPVRGRSAVCRNLDIDLRRMKLLGARCVVCCLDDDELEFLIGATWTEYCQVAHREGLDVLRIPLPEGLAPLSPKSLDADLDRIIEGYSLQGMSVLVHCRGGVGRAGLFACCWMLKLGLCGWIENNIPPSTTTADVAEIKYQDEPLGVFQWDSETVVRRDTLQMVERAIEVVRRRRSVKAIETLEQVQFLVEYVDYLRSCGRTNTS